MVSIVSGNALGLGFTSLATLGQQGSSGTAPQGRSGEKVTVNVASGNLVLQDQDELLASVGLDAAALRTYNSQGSFTDDNADNWSTGVFAQMLRLTGTRNAADSTLTRTSRDGAQAIYSYDAASGSYVSTEGAGAYDRIVFDPASSQYVWTDGDTGVEERYESASTGRLLTSRDPSGNVLTYSYTGELLTQVSDASGESLYFDYSGGDLTQVRTVTADGSTRVRTRYAYDTSHRLVRVATDLSPEDNSIADGRVYTTTYTYDGTSRRVQTLSQTDGTSLSFSYTQVAGSWRIASVADALGHTTHFDYTVSAEGTVTRVRDALDHESVYTSDAQGRLTQVQGPAVNGVSAINSFTYNSRGDVTQIVDAQQHAVTIAYDAQGNQVLQRDAAGNTVTRSFNAANQVLTETVYQGADPDGAGPASASKPLMTRYVYDAADRRVRFVLSPEGRVTEYRYNAHGERTASIDYAASSYPVAGVTATLTEAQLTTWTGTQDRTRTQRMDMAYDARGQLQRTTTYARVDSAGDGVADGTASVVQYVYDQAGRLLSTVSPTNASTAFTYDGLGRMLTSTDALQHVTVNAYDDAHGTTRTTLANGLATTSTYDAAGRLTAVLQSGPGAANLGETKYFYDADDRLLMTQDPTGVRHWSVYDEAGRQVADIDADGSLTEFTYDANNLVTSTLARATRIDTAALVDSNGAPKGLRLDQITRTASPQDRRSWQAYDDANRLVKTVDAQGYVTRIEYDGASRVIAQTQFAKPIDTAGLGVRPLASAIAPASDPADRIARKFYTPDGRLQSELDAENYYTEYVYDAAGRLQSQTSYATPMVGQLVDAFTPPVVVNAGVFTTASAYVVRQIDLSDSGLFDPAGLAQQFEAFRALDPAAALNDLLALIRTAGPALKQAGFDALALLRGWTRNLPADSPLRAAVAAQGIILGDSNANSLNGSAGDDWIDGGAGNDALYGNAGNDTLDGGAGNDQLFGHRGADTYLFGYGSGQDTISNEDDDAPATNADTILLGAGITRGNIVLARSGDSLLIVLNQDDRLLVSHYFSNDGAYSYAVENIRFADGSSLGIADVKALVLQPTEGYDYRMGYAVADTLHGGGGNDSLFGADGADELYGDDGRDRLAGGNGNDLLAGGADNDVLYGEAGDDTLDGGAGNDQLFGFRGADTYLFGYGSGQDTISNEDDDAPGTNADTILLGAGITRGNIVLARSGDSLLIVLNQDDRLLVSHYFSNDGAYSYAVENIRFADGSSLGIADVKALVLQPTEGYDYRMGYAVADTLHGGGGNDSLFGADGADELYGDDGRDRLAGGNGNDLLAGGADNDVLYGEAGDDTLDGGAGNDQLFGFRGADTYLFGYGSGQDTISNEDDDAPGTNADTILLGAGVTRGNIVLTRSGDNLLIVLNQDDRLLVNHYFDSDGANTYAVENIRFADGSSLGIADVKALVLQPTEGYDYRMGYAVADTLHGGGGNDSLFGADGADELYGDDGRDRLAGGNGNDLLAGGSGNDVLYGEAGDDTLDGGAGNDQLFGFRGADTYLFGYGSGQDTISNEDDDTPGTNADTIEFGAGITASDLIFTRPGEHLIVGIGGSDDRLTVNYYFHDDGTSSYTVDAIRLADGTVFNYTDVKSRLSAVTLPAVPGDAPVYGAAGSDALNGSSGYDTLYGGAGNDTLEGGAGEDLLRGEDGNDVLHGGADNDSLEGGNGDDTLWGGAGDDSLQGGAGNDIYLFGRGDGHDTLRDQDGSPTQQDTVQLGAGIAPSDIKLVRSGNELYLAIKDTDDSLRIEGFFYDRTYQLSQVRFADGTVWTPADIETMMRQGTAGNDQLIATAGNDTLSGADGDDTLYGQAGNDTLEGGAGEDLLRGEDGNDVLHGGADNDSLEGGNGDDTLWGGAGDDSLQGGAGNDTYLFGRGDGHDTLRDQDGSPTRQDTVQLGTGIAPSDIKLVRSGNELYLAIKDTDDSLRIEGFFYDRTYQLSQVRFEDGTVWTPADIEAMARQGTAGNDQLVATSGNDALRGAGGDDTLYGQAGNDTLEGGAGEDLLRGEDGNDVLHGGADNDSLEGGNGDDTLWGGAGDDSLQGGAGNDIYLFGRGDGHDTLRDQDGSPTQQDTVQLGAGIAPSDIKLVRSGNELYLAIKDTDDSLRIEGFFYDATYQLSQVRFADGTVWTPADIVRMAATPAPIPDDTNPAVQMPKGVDSRLLFRQVGNDLEINGIGTSSVTLLRDWYATVAQHVDLLSSKVVTAPAGQPLAPTPHDQTTRQLYNARGQVVAQVDAEHYLTENVYDAAGNLSTSILMTGRPCPR